MNVYFFFETVRYTFWHITSILTKFALRALHSILNFPLASTDLYTEPTKNKSFWATTFVASRKFKYEFFKKVSTFFSQIYSLIQEDVELINWFLHQNAHFNFSHNRNIMSISNKPSSIIQTYESGWIANKSFVRSDWWQLKYPFQFTT